MYNTNNIKVLQNFVDSSLSQMGLNELEKTIKLREVAPTENTEIEKYVRDVTAALRTISVVFKKDSNGEVIRNAKGMPSISITAVIFNLGSVTEALTILTKNIPFILTYLLGLLLKRNNG